MLKKKQLEIRAIKKEQLLIEDAEEESQKRLKKLEMKDNGIVKVVEEMKKLGSKY